MQKASNWTPFVILALLFISFEVYAGNCSSQHYDQTVRIAQVYDGDTLQLVDGRKLRLIGINTPERGRDGNPHQPFYTEAKTQLENIIQDNNNQLKIVVGSDKHDRYKRLLTHVFTLDGTNITAKLIRDGMGFNITIPPNLKFLDCYQEAEKTAKKQKRGIWSHPFSQPINASLLSKSKLGFQQVTGKVQRVGDSRSSYWLNMDKNFALRIQKKYLDQFTTYQPKELLGRTLTARGWVYFQNNEYRMSIKHPASIQLQNSD